MAMIQPVLESLRFSNFIFGLVTGDLNNKDAMQRSRGEEGASISWTIGHLLHYRCQVLNLLGKKKESEFKAKFSDMGATNGDDYPDILDFDLKWQELHAEIEEHLPKVSDAQLTEQIENEESPHNEKAVLDVLVFLMWHESYHLGVLGAIRKQLGLTATADLAMSVSK